MQYKQGFIQFQQQTKNNLKNTNYAFKVLE